MVSTALPQCKEISLCLLTPDYPESRLSRAQSARLLKEPMFWVFCWASGQALARFIIDHPHWVKGKRVLDFGCGSGVAAIAAAKSGAQKVWACDLDPCAIDATLLNSQVNSVWVDVISDWETLTEKPDIILAADVLYDKNNLPLLEKFTLRSPEVLVADSRVEHFNVPNYKKIAEHQSFTVPDLGEEPEFGQVNIYYAKIPGVV